MDHSVRRHVLRATVGVGLAGVAGCLGKNSQSGVPGGGGNPTTRASEQPDETSASTTTSDRRGGHISGWTQFGGNAARQGTADTGPRIGRVAWRRTNQAGFNGGPVVADGRVLVVSSGQVRALHAASGDVAWTARAPNGATGPPAVANGRVVVSGDPITAYQLDSGNRVWAAENAAPGAAPPAVSGGVAYTRGQDNRVYAHRVADGSRVWRTVTRAGTPDLGVAVAGENVYVPMATGIAAHGVSGGYRRWLAGKHSMASTPSAVDGVAFAGTAGGSVVAVSDGSQVWRRGAGSVLAGPPAVTGGAVYAVGANSRIMRVQARTGSMSWRQSLGGGSLSSPAVAPQGVYLGTERSLVCLSPGRGVKQWQVPLSAAYRNTPAVASGWLFACGRKELLGISDP